MPSIGGVPNTAFKPKSFPHVTELDGLRAVAVLIVFIGHAKLLPKFPAGFGVTIFFFLSGYLITSLMRIEHENKGTIDLRGFYIRRFLRINPPLWLSMIAMSALVAVGLLDVRISLPDVVSQAFFFANYMPNFAQGGGLPSPLWSLAVEEHFYLAFPLIFMKLAGRYRSSTIASGCFVACCLIAIVRMINLTIFDLTIENYYWTHTRIDSILFGAILALWNNPLMDEEDSLLPINAWHFCAAICLILATFLIDGDVFEYSLKYSLQGIAIFVIFFYLIKSRSWIFSPLNWRVFQIIGLYSYTIYLMHYAFIIVVDQNFSDFSPYIKALISWGLSLAFAHGMYVIVERPLGNLRKRMNARSQATVADGVSGSNARA